MNRIVMSSGHGKYVRGASGVLDEVDEARRVVERAAADLRSLGVDVVTFHDDVSKTQSENLNRIVDFHNGQVRDLDVSVHFNAYEQTSKPMGTEVLFVTQEEMATELSAAIASNGFVDRGAKKRTDLYFLNETSAPAVLIETCFVDSEADAKIYNERFTSICQSIAISLSDAKDTVSSPPPLPAPLRVVGRVSAFGGPEDMGVDADEGLAFISAIEQAQQLFLPFQPEGTTGLARRLNPYVHYVACRWDYDVTSKEMLRSGEVALVTALTTGVSLKAFPADWGPHEDTGRVADISPGLMDDLGIGTDDEVEIIFPWMAGV